MTTSPSPPGRPEHFYADPYSAPTQGVVAMADGVAVAPTRAVLIDCTGAGTIGFTFVDGSALVTMNLQANTLLEFNWSVTKFTKGSATVTVTAEY